MSLIIPSLLASEIWEVFMQHAGSMDILKLKGETNSGPSTGDKISSSATG